MMFAVYKDNRNYFKKASAPCFCRCRGFFKLLNSVSPAEEAASGILSAITQLWGCVPFVPAGSSSLYLI
ncbi:hypothetical protein HMPREF1548_03484 [Clostridium sp. KLE 1755]|nr:hypothetical protein HMPREF1548_03484 [Clostridium sp. KLE 1755]